MWAPLYRLRAILSLFSVTVLQRLLSHGRSGTYAVKASNLRTQTSVSTAPSLPVPGERTRALHTGAGTADEPNGQNKLERPVVEESACSAATQSIVVIDGGSTGTRPYLLTVQTQSCPGLARSAQYETLRFVAQGRTADALHMVLQEWLVCFAGKGWSRRSSTPKRMLMYLAQLKLKAAELVAKLLEDCFNLIEEKLTTEDREHAKLLGIPVIFHSTAGVRVFPAWYISAFFVAIRQSIEHVNHHSAYRVFTSPELTGPLSGEKEGMYTFLTVNFLTGRLGQLKKGTSEGGNLGQSWDLAGLVEIGGASAQVVLPVNPHEPPPPFVKLVNLHEYPLFSKDLLYPRVLSFSLMHLGAATSREFLLKRTCQKRKYRSAGVCTDPCLPEGYRQPCSLGPITITADGQVQVDDTPEASSLAPVANFCAPGNELIASQQTLQQWCTYHQLDPSKRVSENLEIPGCTVVEGGGDFDSCFAEVESTLMNLPVPFPSNIEALMSGITNYSDIAYHISSDATVYICGEALVRGVNMLTEYGLLPEGWDGRNISQLVRATRDFCKISVGVDQKDGLVFRMPPVTGRRHLKAEKYTVDTCSKLAQAVSIVSYLLASGRRPRDIHFRSKIDGVELTWHYGAVLDRITRKSYWSRIAYEGTSNSSYSTVHPFFGETTQA